MTSVIEALNLITKKKLFSTVIPNRKLKCLTVIIVPISLLNLFFLKNPKITRITYIIINVKIYNLVFIYIIPTYIIDLY